MARESAARQVESGDTPSVCGPVKFQIVTLVENSLLTYHRASEIFGISGTELKEAKAAGLIAFVQAGRRGVRFRVSEINRYILDRETRMQRGTRRIS
jgi:hypothetical protein